MKQHTLNILWKPILLALLIPLSLLSSGCESVSYYYQALEGQLSLISKRTPIPEVIQNQSTADTTKEKLKLVLEVREFAQQHLLLEVGDHYSQYVGLDRPYVVWNVFAAPEFSIKPKTWCYPIAGCVAYKGYFDESNALQKAEQLSQQGYDTYVGGVAAYSTLGWFEDPVLSTFVNRSDAALAGLLIHELAHQKLYVQDDSAFNESFATAVEILGLEQWLAAKGQSQDLAAINTHRTRKKQFVELVLKHRSQLEALYKKPLPDEEKKKAKQIAQQGFLQQYAELKESWGGYSGYDRWFAKPVNNAQLSTVATYHHWVGSFVAIYHQHQGDWNKFYEMCHEIAQLDRALRDQSLEKLSVEGRNYRL